MGSSGKGIVGDLINPFGAVARKTGANWVRDIDPVSAINQQTIANTADMMSGKADFGVHRNWFGEGRASDLLNSMVGSTTTATRKTEDFNQAMEKAREDMEALRSKKSSTKSKDKKPGGKRSTILTADTTGNTVLG